MALEGLTKPLVILAGLLLTSASCPAGDAAPGAEAGSVNWQAEFTAKLEVRTSLEFVETPLGQAIESLSRDSGVPCIIEPASLEGAGNIPITLRLSNTSKSLALKWILRMARLDYELRPGAIYIRAPDGASGWPKETKPPEAPGADERRLDELLSAFQKPVQPAEPTAEQKASIARLVADFGAEDFVTRQAASAAAAKLGGEALEAMRRAAGSSDPEVAERAKAAVAAIENGARTSALEAVRKLPKARELLTRKLAETAGAWGVKAKAFLEAEKAHREKDLPGLLEEARSASERHAAARTILVTLAKAAAGPDSAGR